MRGFGFAELEDDFAFSDETEIVACDAFDGGGVIAQVANLDAKVGDVMAELRIFSVRFVELMLEGAHSWQALGLENEHGRADNGDG
jgi:hypothetical protein